MQSGPIGQSSTVENPKQSFRNNKFIIWRTKMNNERREQIQQHVQKSFKQDRERQAEVSFNAHWQAGTDEQSDDRNNQSVRTGRLSCSKPNASAQAGHLTSVQAMRDTQNEDELLCACTGLKCEGICRKLHLHRPRFASPTAKNTGKTANMKPTQWAKRCPESYYPTDIIGRKNIL